MHTTVQHTLLLITGLYDWFTIFFSHLSFLLVNFTFGSTYYTKMPVKVHSIGVEQSMVFKNFSFNIKLFPNCN